MLINLRILARVSNGVALAEVDSNKGNSEKAHDNNNNLKGSLSIVSSSPVSILPDNVSGLSSFNQEEIIAQKVLVL